MVHLEKCKILSAEGDAKNVVMLALFVDADKCSFYKGKENCFKTKPSV